MKKITIKDVVYITIITILIVLLILSKIDNNINIISKDNWIDIIMGIIAVFPSLILSIIVYNFEKLSSSKQEKLEKTIFNKELETQLREERLEIFSSLMSLGTFNIINIKNYIVTNFIGGKHELNANKIQEIINKEKEITNAYCKSILIFKKDKKVLKITEECFNLFVEYRQALQQFMADCYVANQKSIEYLNKNGYSIATPYLPLEIIEHHEEFENCKEIFFEYYKDAEIKEKEIRELISNKDTILAFDKYINIDKIGVL